MLARGVADSLLEGMHLVGLAQQEEALKHYLQPLTEAIVDRLFQVAQQQEVVNQAVDLGKVGVNAHHSLGSEVVAAEEFVTP